MSATVAIAIAMTACAKTNATSPDYGGADGGTVSTPPQLGNASPAGPPTQASHAGSGAPATVMVLVPGGSYEKGPHGNAPGDSRFRVHVAPFEIDRTEVTVAAYGACMQAGRCKADTSKCKAFPPDVPDHPVTCVTALEAARYCEWQGKRLPSSAEWEIAAHGPNGVSYPWGDAKPEHVCIGRNPYPQDGSTDEGTCAVGTNPQDTSPFGVLDMAGNVSELTSTPSEYELGYDDPAERGGYQPSSGTTIARGGSWRDPRGSAPSTLTGGKALDRGNFVGFRCARSVPGSDGGLQATADDALAHPSEGQMVHVGGGTLPAGVDGGATAAVSVAAFEIDVIEVTASAYAKCVEAKRCTSTLPDNPSMRGYEQTHAGAACTEGKEPLAEHPMNCLNAKQAAAYCTWMKKRLPTELEWQFAAGGGDGRTFPWGEADPNKKPCWDRPGGAVPYTGTCPVATHPDDVSPLGVYDMAGNVSEWTTGPAGAGFIEKGGSWQTAARYSPPGIANRHDRSNLPDGGDTTGFRCAR